MPLATTEQFFSTSRDPFWITNFRARRRACILGSVAAIIVVGVAYLVFSGKGPWHDTRHREPSKFPKLLKIRVFWARHGLSCANVLDKCSKGQADAKRLLPRVQKATSHKLNTTFGLEASTATGGDCTVEIEAPSLIPDQRGENGALVLLHSLYTDPAITDCARMQCAAAGRSFLKWLQTKRIHIDLVGSSFLLRAVETAYAMLRAPCSGENALDCTDIFASKDAPVTPLPYMVERARSGETSIQQDNMPRDEVEQQQLVKDIYGRLVHMDPTYTSSWPRNSQQYEKFKAVLAMVIAPSISKNVTCDAPPVDVFRAAVESTLPERMDADDHGKPVSIKWEGGSYSTGIEFDKNEYIDLWAPEVNIVLVGHNQMMSEYCLAPDYLPKPNNNAVLEKLFILEVPPEGSHHTVLRELRGRCQQVMGAPPTSMSWRELATADVATCKDPFAVADFLDLARVRSLKNTDCVKNAPESAFPILPPFL